MQSDRDEGWIDALLNGGAAPRFVGILAVLAAVAWLLLADYPPMALGGLVALYFAGYVGLRVLVWMEGNRFSPDHLRVGLTWALLGVDTVTNRFDRRPVVMYFLMLAVLFFGLLLRPLARWVLG